MTSFGLDIFKRIYTQQRGELSQKNDDSILLSPQSIWSALLLTYLGTGGNTAEELEKVLGISDKDEALRTMELLENTNSQRNERYPKTLLNSERLYFDKRSRIRSDIQEGVLKERIKIVDFAENTKTSKEINDYVFNATLGTINKIVSPEMIKKAVDLVLINAIYFKGNWQYKYDPVLTCEGKFFKGGSSPSSSSSSAAILDFMNTKRKYNYGKYDSRAHLLEIPYTADDLSMYILLPLKPGDDELDNVVMALNARDLRREMDNMSSTTVELILPKFKLDTTLRGDELIPVLNQMGINDLFEGANFEKFFKNDDDIPHILDEIIQKTCVEVSEEGTEARAVTSMLVAQSISPDNEIYMRCNRPFIFYIFDKAVDKILFIGIFKN